MRTTQERGFTLVELVVVVVVSAILLTVGVPALQDMVRNNRLVTATNELVTHLNLARSEAVKRRRAIQFCSTRDPQASPPSCDGAPPDWGTGWLVVADLDDDGVFSEWMDSDGDGQEDSSEIFRRVPPATRGVTVHASAAGTVSFRPDGSASASLVFGLCDSRGAERGRQVQLEAIGRVSTVAYGDTRWLAAGCTP